MTTLTLKATMNNMGVAKKGLWTCLKDYLVENQQIIFAGSATISGVSFYTYNRAFSR